jgi:putative transposase
MVSETTAAGARERTQRTVTLDQSALLEVLDALKTAEVDDRIGQAAQTIYQALIEAELTSVIGAAPHQRTPERSRPAQWPPAQGAGDHGRDLELRIPSCGPGRSPPRCWSGAAESARPCSRWWWRRTCTESAPARSTTWSGPLGADSGISKSEVSRICADLDGEVAGFRDRSLAGQRFPYVFVDATSARPESTAGSSPKPS